MTLITHYLNHKGNGTHFDRKKCWKKTNINSNIQWHRNTQLSSTAAQQMYNNDNTLHILNNVE